MALDYRNSHFTAVDVLDLLPADFEDTEANVASNQDGHELKSAPTVVNNMTVFTPMHPDLSSKLQNTTTPVIDSSTLDSSLLLSQIDEIGSSNISSCMTTESSVMSASRGEDDDDDADVHQDTRLPVPVVLVNGQSKQPSAPAAPCEAPKKRTLLHNLDFYQANVVDAKLPFADNHFDFVKQRLVTASFTLADWKRVMAELVRVTKPGGYIELLEIDYNTHNLGPNGRRWERECKCCSEGIMYSAPSMPYVYSPATHVSNRGHSTKETNGTQNRSTFGRSSEDGRFDRCIVQACVYPSWIMGP